VGSSAAAIAGTKIARRTSARRYISCLFMLLPLQGQETTRASGTDSSIPAALFG
jgi:hypothetical protein